MSKAWDAICEIYEGRAHKRYGLTSISQAQHALQAAEEAERQGASPALIVAALLHDVGHMVHDLGEAPAEDGIDDWHELLGAQWLARWFGPAVSEPVRLHVAAKRYLCSVEPGYLDQLSDDSVLSLEIQGGPMDADEAAAFILQPFAQDAITLRRFDEAAKSPDSVTKPLEAFRGLVDAVAERATIES